MLLDSNISRQSSPQAGIGGFCGVIAVDRSPGIRMVVLRRDVPGRCFSSSPLNGQGRGRKTGNKPVR